MLNVRDIKEFNKKILFIKKNAKLEDNLLNLKIDSKKNSSKILKGINLLRLGNNPVKIDEKDIFKIISNISKNQI